MLRANFLLCSLLRELLRSLLQFRVFGFEQGVVALEHVIALHSQRSLAGLLRQLGSKLAVLARQVAILVLEHGTILGSLGLVVVEVCLQVLEQLAVIGKLGGRWRTVWHGDDAIARRRDGSLQAVH